MYIIKIQGTSKIPDYVQIRDDDFTLVAYFKSGRPGKALEACGLAGRKAEIMETIQELEYGLVTKI